MSTPRESIRAAFKAVLDAANLGVTVYSRLPFEGADVRSVVLTIISGTSKSPGIGLRKDVPKRGLMEQYRLQVDCNYDDKTECGKLADVTEQALMDSIDTLRDTYDIHNLRKVLDIDTLPLGSSASDILTREARVLLDFQFWTHRELAT